MSVPTVIIKVKNGLVEAVYADEPVNYVIADADIEGQDTSGEFMFTVAGDPCVTTVCTTKATVTSDLITNLIIAMIKHAGGK